jgi:energy-coupling factor transport system permease protein
MIISLAIRFVPTLLQESQRILNAQSSRGCDFANGDIKQKGKALISLIIPMFTISFLKSNDLANAMDVRSYNPRFRRTVFRTYRIKIIDYLFISLFCVFIGFTFALAISQRFISIFGYSDILLRYGVS